MKKRYEVKWYELNLTIPKTRKFFTKMGAIIFAAYIEAYDYAEPIIKEL